MSGSLLLVWVCVAGVIITPTLSLAQSTEWPPQGATQKRYYIEYSFKEDWYGAYTACILNNSRLARVESAEENATILQMIAKSSVKGHRYWIGANDLAREGHWTWLLTGQPVEYSNWNNGEPNDINGGEDCASYELFKPFFYKWNDEICTLPRYFICEYYGAE